MKEAASFFSLVDSPVGDDAAGDFVAFDFIVRLVDLGFFDEISGLYLSFGGIGGGDCGGRRKSLGWRGRCNLRVSADTECGTHDGE